MAVTADMHREQWVAVKLLDSPDGVVTRAALREAAPLKGTRRRSDAAYANRKAKGLSGCFGSRSAEYIRRGIKDLEREGFVRREDDRVILLDREGLIRWLYEDEDWPTGAGG